MEHDCLGLHAFFKEIHQNSADKKAHIKKGYTREASEQKNLWSIYSTTLHNVPLHNKYKEIP